MTAESRVAVLSGPRKFEFVERARPVPREGEALDQDRRHRGMPHRSRHVHRQQQVGALSGRARSRVDRHRGGRRVRRLRLDAGADGAHQSRHHVRPLRLVPARPRAPVPQRRSVRARDRRLAQPVRDARHALPLSAARRNCRSTMRRSSRRSRRCGMRRNARSCRPANRSSCWDRARAGFCTRASRSSTGCDPVIAVSRTRWKLERAIGMGARARRRARREGRRAGSAAPDGRRRRRCGDRYCRRRRHDARRHRHAAPRRPVLLVLAEPRAVCRRERVSALLQGSEHHRLARADGRGHHARPSTSSRAGKIDVSGFVSNTYPLERGGRGLQGIRGQSEPVSCASSSIRRPNRTTKQGSAMEADFHRQRRAAGDPRDGQALRRRRSEAACGEARRRSRSGRRFFMGDRREGARSSASAR